MSIVKVRREIDNEAITGCTIYSLDNILKDEYRINLIGPLSEKKVDTEWNQIINTLTSFTHSSYKEK